MGHDRPVPSVVLLSPVVPAAEPQSAGYLFLAEYAKALAHRGWTVTVVGLWPEAAGGTPLDGLLPNLRTQHLGHRSRLRRLFFELSTWPIDLVRAPCLPPLATAALLRRPAVREAIRAADAVELHFGQTRTVLPGVRRLNASASVCAFAHDVLSESFGRRRRFGPRWRRLADHVRFLSARRLEPRFLNQVDRVTVFTERDRRQLRDLHVRTPIDVSAAFVDLPPTPSRRGSHGVVGFVGPMWRPENATGIAWFVQEVWPLVRARHPDARLRVAGAGPVADAPHGVEYLGFVPDLEAFFRQLDVFVAPLLIGAGLKFKVLQAFAHGLPVVATTVAAEGIELPADGPPFARVHDDPAHFAAAVSELLGDVGGALRLGHEARSWIEQTYDFTTVVDQAIARFEGTP